MPNSIRTPKKGLSATSRRIAQAVDDEEWQKFRLSMKGKDTFTKLDMLRGYYSYNIHPHEQSQSDAKNCDICIRVDNYIKALCRGGQLFPKLDIRDLFRLDQDLVKRSR